MKKIAYAIAILMAAVSCNKAADTVVLGTIRTAEEENPVVEAIAVKDGKYIYVGDKAILEGKSKDVDVMIGGDLRGKESSPERD